MDIRSLLGYLGQIQLDREYRLKYYWFWLAPSTTKAWGGRTPEWRWCIIEARHGSCIGHEGAKDFWENYGWSFYHGCSGIHWLYMRGWSKLERYPSVPCFFTFDSHWAPLRDISVSSKLSLEIGSVLEIFMDSWNHGRDEKSLGVCDHLCRYQWPQKSDLQESGLDTCSVLSWMLCGCRVPLPNHSNIFEFKVGTDITFIQ